MLLFSQSELDCWSDKMTIFEVIGKVGREYGVMVWNCCSAVALFAGNCLQAQTSSGPCCGFVPCGQRHTLSLLGQGRSDCGGLGLREVFWLC